MLACRFLQDAQNDMAFSEKAWKKGLKKSGTTAIIKLKME